MQIVNCTSDWVINNSNNEEIIFNQRKWLEILVDFILNLREGDKKSLDESEYVKIFNYHQFYSIEIMKFFFEVFTECIYHSSQVWNCFKYLSHKLLPLQIHQIFVVG